MISQSVVEEVWQLTKSGHSDLDSEYALILAKVLNTPKRLRYRTPFEVQKKSGGTRRIVPAKAPLVFIQQRIAEWIIVNFPPVNDYCYSGQGVLAAVKAHLGSKFALVLDLKSAFDHVSAERIEFVLRYVLSKTSIDAIKLLVDLVTYPADSGKEIAPQGCVSTPYVYNLVLWQLDRQVDLVLKTFPVMKYTRYSDNLCFSSAAVFDHIQLLKKVRSVIEGQGFEIGWAMAYEKPPFEYLGTLIYTHKVGLSAEKHVEYLALLDEAIASKTPNSYRRKVAGMFGWCRQVFGECIPEDLLSLFMRYYGRVHRPPASLNKVVTAQKNMSFL